MGGRCATNAVARAHRVGGDYVDRDRLDLAKLPEAIQRELKIEIEHLAEDVA